MGRQRWVAVDMRNKRAGTLRHREGFLETAGSKKEQDFTSRDMKVMRKHVDLSGVKQTC